MLLSGVLFVLFLAGCWLYCLTDAALTPAVEYRGLSKSTWIYIISATFIVGALAWLIARRSRRSKSWVTASAGYTWHSPWEADAAVARHPAGRAKQPSRDRQHVPQGPDDDPEFLRQLDRSIRGTSADPGELRAVTWQPASHACKLAPSQPRRISTAASCAARAQRTVTSRPPQRTVWTRPRANGDAVARRSGSGHGRCSPLTGS